MALVPLKRRRRVTRSPPAEPPGPGRFPSVVLCLVERRMGASRRAFLTQLAQAKGFRVDVAYSAAVTHVVSEQNSGAEVAQWLGGGEGVTAPAAPHGGLMASYACQRRTPLLHSNQALTEALEILAEEARFSGSEGRSLAFTRAASVLKALPGPLGTLGELGPLPGIGEHSRRVIQDVLEDGVSAEVERVKLSERYQTMKVPDLVGGWGAVGFGTGTVGGAGVPHVAEISRPAQGLILYQHSQESSFVLCEGPGAPGARDCMDRFERCFSILRLEAQRGQRGPGAARGWKAVRVDLVVAPISQFPFALLGWTGSQHFERELRRFARHERKMVLNSHALYDTQQMAGSWALAAPSMEEPVR
nr:DNA-directed DNA/RNA polymerase mu [Pelodiscus sinensis]|eukprot:XP_014434749.1 DNA-directed DNA/RNA polymerase mu [Pelodiscus sinensis]